MDSTQEYLFAVAVFLGGWVVALFWWAGWVWVFVLAVLAVGVLVMGAVMVGCVWLVDHWQGWHAKR